MFRRLSGAGRKPGIVGLGLGVLSAVGMVMPTSALADDGAFTFIQPGFTQQLWGEGAPFFAQGIAFAPNGDVLGLSGGTLVEWGSTTSTVNGSSVHSIIASNPVANAWVGMANGADGSVWVNTGYGLQQIDPYSGAAIGAPIGNGGNGLGTALDPQTHGFFYACGGICYVDPANPAGAAYLSSYDSDGLAIDPTGNFLFLSEGPALTILKRDGTFVQTVYLDSADGDSNGGNTDGVAFHATSPKFVLTNNTDGSQTRFDFPSDDYTQTPTQSLFANGGSYGDLGATFQDGCLYASQQNVRYADGTVGGSGVVRVCGGFAPSVPSTTVTYTGATSGQYSDPVTVSASVTSNSGTPISGATVNFTLGSQSTSAVTNPSGVASTSLTLNQAAGPTTVQATFAGDGTNPAGSSGQQAFTVNKEDCTQTVPPTILSTAASPTTLTSQFGELDATHGAWGSKSISFSGADSSSNPVGPFAGTTDSTGAASASAPLAAGVYTIGSSFAGDSYYNSCASDAAAPTIVTVSPAAYKVTGGGWTSNTTGRTSFGFNALTDVTGLHGQIQIRTPNKGSFHGSTVTSLITTTHSAQWSGTGVWNGHTGFTYSVSAYDGGSGSKGDTVSIVISSGATTVWSTGGSQTLKGGNLTVHS